MNVHRLELRRGELLLGAVDSSDIPDLLAEGFLVITDEFKAPGSWRWRPLVELGRYLADSQSGFVDRLRTTATDIVETVRESAASSAASVSETAGKAFRTATATPTELLELWVPKISALTDGALAGASGTIQSFLADEPFLRKLFGAVYDSLPKPVQRFVTEEDFIGFCLKHRARLLKQRSSENQEPQNSTVS